LLNVLRHAEIREILIINMHIIRGVAVNETIT